MEIDNAIVKKYPAYKDSGVEWTGLVPENWGALPIRAIFEERNEKNDGRKTEYILSVTKDRGVIPYDEKGAIGNNKSEEIERYKLVYPNDFVINKMNVVIGSLGMSKYFGAFSQVYLVYKPRTSQININYYSYIFSNPSFYKSLIKYCTGIMELRESLNKEDFKKLILPFPDYQTQTAIVEYLDNKTALIDQAIEIKQKQIELLKERRQILIHKAVTRGLNPNVKMKDSGVEWIGEIPENWEVRRSKFLFTQRKERSRDGDIQLSATQAYGVIPQEEYESKIERRVVKIQFHLEKRKHVEIDDFVISMRSFQGGLERAWSSGCIRSSYVVLRPLEKIDATYYSYLLKSPKYIKALQSTASFIRDGQDLSFENFAMVDLFIPPLKDQQEISESIEGVVKKTTTAISLIEQEIERLKEYKATLINSAVTGKLRVPSVQEINVN
jgi:type I restriction enzyme S subunit